MLDAREVWKVTVERSVELRIGNGYAAQVPSVVVCFRKLLFEMTHFAWGKKRNSYSQEFARRRKEIERIKSTLFEQIAILPGGKDTDDGRHFGAIIVFEIAD